MYTAADFVFLPQEPARCCPRCKGQRTIDSDRQLPMNNRCFRCFGEGTVLSRQDSRRAKTLAALRSQLQGDMQARAISRGRVVAESVNDGYMALEELEPHRLPALYASLANGRFDEVIDALTDYFRVNARKLCVNQAVTR